MPNSSHFIAHVIEMMRPVRVTAKAMFGGHGLYADDAFVAIVVDDGLYLKCDEQSAPVFDALALEPFVYVARDGKRMTMSYRAAPEEALESPDAMRPWLRHAIDAALRAARGTAGRPRKSAQAKRPRRRRGKRSSTRAKLAIPRA